MRQRDIVTCFLQNKGRILLLKRSPAVRTQQGKWAGVSGGIEGQSSLAQAFQEIREETGLGEDQLRLLKEGEPLDVIDSESDVNWRVHPFLFAAEDPSSVRLDWEHTDCQWIDPADIEQYETVPMLRETWDRLREKRRKQSRP